MEKNKNLSKEAKCFFTIGILTAAYLVIGGIDSIADHGFFRGILDIIICIAVGAATGAIATACYIIADAVAPKKIEKILSKLTTEPKEDYYLKKTED
ncbi:MAG: hypothetical protein NC218_05255 [Acetobacter sp.]|nr:hypothetical protein [Acetobacter sp.]